MENDNIGTGEDFEITSFPFTEILEISRFDNEPPHDALGFMEPVIKSGLERVAPRIKPDLQEKLKTSPWWLQFFLPLGSKDM